MIRHEAYPGVHAVLADRLGVGCEGKRDLEYGFARQPEQIGAFRCSSLS